ncbi:MAG: hypothetical protein ACLFQ2_13135 [Wenzhouxiangella sp.]
MFEALNAEDTIKGPPMAPMTEPQQPMGSQSEIALNRVEWFAIHPVPGNPQLPGRPDQNAGIRRHRGSDGFGLDLLKGCLQCRQCIAIETFASKPCLDDLLGDTAALAGDVDMVILHHESDFGVIAAGQHLRFVDIVTGRPLQTQSQISQQTRSPCRPGRIAITVKHRLP